MSDQIEMPTPCIECGGIWDLNSLYRHPYSRDALVCADCKREIENGDLEEWS